MKLTTSAFKTTEFGIALVHARTKSPVTLTTRNQEDLILIKKSDLDKITDKHKQLEIQHSIEAKALTEPVALTEDGRITPVIMRVSEHLKLRGKK